MVMGLRCDAGTRNVFQREAQWIKRFIRMKKGPEDRSPGPSYRLVGWT